MGPSVFNYIKAAEITFDCQYFFLHHSKKREKKYIKSSENSVKLFILKMSNLCVVVVGPFIVGQLQLAERDFLPHPMSTGVGRFGVDVHFVT